jgi:glycosyltransferase involved in cell wall biosynthesis
MARAPAPTTIAYIAAEYPKVSHTFIQREIAALRRAGARVRPITIRRTPASGLLGEEDRREAAMTYAVLPTTWQRLVAAHARTALRAPRRYAGTLRLALRLSAPGARNRLWQLFYFAEAGLVADELRRGSVDRIHAHFVNVAAWVALLAAELGDVPWSFTMHGPLEFDNVEFHGIPEKVRRAEFVACISDFARAQLMRLVEPAHWPKLHIVHCGVRPADYPAAPARDPAGPLEIVSVGRLDAMKGFSVLLDAFGELLAGGTQARLTLVGDGAERATLEAQARGRGIGHAVRFTGSVDAAEVTRRLAAADVFCLPSFAEGVPVVLMEAMASGLPVVSTWVMGIPELVRDGAGVLVPPGRPEPLAAALAGLAGDAQARRRMGEAGRAIVARDFDVDRSAHRLLGLFAPA